jgi:signal transduction histidine kinase
MNVEKLSEAFQNFTTASKSLETYYDLLQEKVRYLTAEIERKNRQLADALDEAERNREYLNAILYNLEEAIIVVNPDNRITMMNKSAESLLDLQPIDVIGKKYNDLEISVAEFGPDTYLTVKGKRHSVIISQSPVMQPEGQLKGSVILIKDISRLRELEMQQERNQRLIAMGEMSAKIVHEIRNPLCSIALFASMLEKDLENPSQKELAGGISTGIHNLNNILKNMLFFARPNTPVMKKVKLKSVIEDSLKMFAPMTEARKITVEQTLHDIPTLGDAELLKQVLINIIVNAIQSMPEGGTFSITMRHERKNIVVDIRDTGEGIRQELIESIFNPFFSTKDNGTGLGLAIASMIMQGHGGYIKAESEEGKGSVFSLYFPQKEDE